MLLQVTKHKLFNAVTTVQAQFNQNFVMKDSLRSKLEVLVNRQEEINAQLSDASIIQDLEKFRNLSIELSEISEVVEKYQLYSSLEKELEDVKLILNDQDTQIKEMAQSEASDIETQLDQTRAELHKLLLPKDPNDAKNVYLEIRAGTGGDEAAIFAGDLCRMYQNYVQSQGWNSTFMSKSEGEHGGYKEVVLRIEGRGAFSKLKFESGTHRVQRVPKTEAQGRIHTSACTVAVLPEADKIDEIDLNPQDIRVDTFRASGSGGQHVNRTDSAIRLTHFPSGIVVECQDERSQHQNKARAMAILRARLLDMEIRKQQEQRSATRKLMVGSGDRSERIRTYNFPQGRVSDHRINLTLYRLDEFMEGATGLIIEPLITEHQAELMAETSQAA